MAVTTTTLAAAMGRSDLVAVLTSATGAVTGNLLVIGGEYMTQTGDPVGVIIPVRRGLNGSAQVIHANGASVQMGLTSDFDAPEPVQASVYVGTTLTGDGSSASPLEAVATGTGDVVGPASAVDGTVAAFDGATGKLIADSGVAAADLVVTSDLDDLVVGPASVTAGKVAIFDGTTGKLIEADAAGATAGPFTVITSIEVVNGLVVTLTGS